MSGNGRNPVVPVDVVQGIVSQLSEVSQHTTSATTAMRHLVAEIANLRELRTRDATSVVEALAAASTRSGSPGAVDNGVGGTTDPAVRKVPEVRWQPGALFTMVCGSGGEEGAEAVVGSSGNHFRDRGFGRAREGYGGRR